MSNETEVKPEAIIDAEVIAPTDAVVPATEPVAAEEAVVAEGGSSVPIEPIKIVAGRVVIDVSGQGLKVEAPQNLLLALAVLNAGKVFLEMQYADALRGSLKAQPKIVRPGDVGGIGAMMNRLGKPS